MKHHPESSAGKPDHCAKTPAQGANFTEPLGLKRRHFMGSALALDAAALLAACGGGGGGGSGGGSGGGANYPWAVTTLAGTGAIGADNGAGGTATFYTPAGVAVDSSGHVYVAEFNNHLIRKISPAGVVSTLAGTGTSGAVNGSGVTASFSYPKGVAVDASGNVYVADQLNNRIRMINPDGVVSTLAGLSMAGRVDGSGVTAKFYNPFGVAVDASGAVFVADLSNHQIRKISPQGEVSTLAGVGGTAGYEDGSAATAKMDNPAGVAVDFSGNVYVADYNNHLIRKISPQGEVSTLAGTAGVAGADNGTGTTAKFSNPRGVAVDGNGNVYVADASNHRIRKITPVGVVSTVAGTGEVGHDNGNGGLAKFYTPTGVAVAGNGVLYVADYNNQLIRKISPIF